MNPSISIIITHALSSSNSYLELCLESLRRQNIPKEVIVVSSAHEPPPVPDFVKLFWEPEPSSYAEKINFGIAKSDPNTPYILLGQDDLVFGKDCIASMIEGCGKNLCLITPLSNCDNSWLYHANFELMNEKGERLILPRFFKKELLENFEEAAMSCQTNLKALFPATSICLYSCLMPRLVWDIVGGLDPQYQNGCEDSDFVYHAKQKGFNSFVSAGSFVIHFGGVSSSKMVRKEENDRNYLYFKQKWGISLKDIV